VFCGLVVLVTSLSVYEASALLRRRQWRIYELPVLAALLVMLSSGVVGHVTGTQIVVTVGPSPVGPAAAVLTILLVSVFVAEVLRAARTGDVGVAVESIGGTMLVALYIGVPLLFVVAIRFLPDGLHSLLAYLAVAKSADVGAYAVGRLFGRRKLVPKLSPGKTVEGLLGGMVLSTAVAVTFGQTLLEVAWPQAALFGLVVSVAAVLGDLAESLIKRATQIKDSSHMVPGFGGILDLMDSILFTAPAAYLMFLMMARP
jgi:phosphatidate cytidylyltransferase